MGCVLNILIVLGTVVSNSIFHIPRFPAFKNFCTYVNHTLGFDYSISLRVSERPSLKRS